MLRFFTTQSLGRKLIIFFLIITIVPAVIISYFYYRVSQNNLEKNMIDSSRNELIYTMDIIDKQLKNAGQFSDWIFVNRSLDNLLTRNLYKQNIIVYDSAIQDFRNFIDIQLLSNLSVGDYVLELVISGRNGFDLRAGNDAAVVDKIAIQKTAWFKEGLKHGGKVDWYGVVKNPAVISHENYIIPLVRPILHSFTNRTIGWHMIGFRISLIADILRKFEIKNDESLLLLDPRGFCVYHNEYQQIGRDFSKLEYLRGPLKKESDGYIHVKINGKPRLIVFAKSKLTNWTIVKILSSDELNRQKGMLFNITLIILLASFVITSLLTIYFTNNITFQLAKLLQQIRAIASGSFYRDPSIEGKDELGILGYGINEMAVNIRNLLDQVVKDEQEKRRMELEMLQYQVNPHFLYNTLNSLKLMATIQKADGIKEMVTALGRLIMNLSKNSSEKITLEEEIMLLNDYVYIQNIRYKGKIKLEYRWGNKDFLKCKIIKFTLQPIVENAIFHGIEPKKDAGKIIISVSNPADYILICVEDDGVGMTAEQIESVLTNGPSDINRGLSGIGVKNVAERIKLSYGLEFGLSIESVVGEYTKVYIKIPREI